jgi:two-component system, OmpR family, sensor histidine kinase BaeS
VKFTPAGGKICAHIACDGPSHAHLAVSDTGPGIPPQHVARVFDRFYRVDESRTGTDRGGGLGLSIAKWAVEANNGEIGVSSSVGSGSTFWIRLPAVGCPPPSTTKSTIDAAVSTDTLHQNFRKS